MTRASSIPIMLWLHGVAQDETSFLHEVVRPLDQAIANGLLPPLIIAAPDGSLRGISGLFSAGSFYLNTPAGRFEDYLMVDVWNFLVENFPIRPEREAHVIAGASMGGGAAFNKGFKYPERFGIAVGFFPAGEHPLDQTAAAATWTTSTRIAGAGERIILTAARRSPATLA